MKRYEFSLKVISPSFIAGTDKNAPEMRTTTLRGQWRYWGRAYLGATYPQASKVYEEEAKAFGSTTAGARFSVVLYPPKRPAIESYPMLPHREGGSNPVSPAKAIIEATYRLMLVPRPLQPLDKAVWQGFKLWSLLGGVGRRSRRMFGGVSVSAQSDVTQAQWYAPPQTPQDIADTIKALLKEQKPVNQTPEFPILAPNKAWIVVGQEAFGSAKEANQAFFRVLRNNKYRAKSNNFGSVRPVRFASPVHAQVRRIGNDYYPVITAFLAKPRAVRDFDEKLLGDFMKDISDEFNAIQAWGGW
jgi:CRISPR-associated protein Cmr1